MYYLVSHVVYQNEVAIFGPIHVVAEYLKIKKGQFIQMTAPLTFEGEYEYVYGKKIEKKFIKYTNTLLKYVGDFKFFFTKILDRFPTENDTIIAADPLSAFPFVFLRFFYDFKLIYYTVDYADRRFDNILIEYVYRFLDKAALGMSDSNWCVSTRIVEIRKKEWFGNKAVFVPNTNISTERPSLQKEKYKNSLIYVGRMEKNMFVFEILEACKKMLKQKIEFSLTLIGGGNLSQEIESQIKKLKLEKVVKYLGPISNDKVQKQLVHHGIGLALYGDSKNWNRYGDSMKIREYQQFGLPVITTDVPSNAQEVESEKAGIVLPYNSISSGAIISAVQMIQDNYMSYTKQANKLAKANLKMNVLDRLLTI